jgi:peptide/nickel transport system substrate-binding protein
MRRHSALGALAAMAAATALAVAGCAATPEEADADREIVIAVSPGAVDIASWDPFANGPSGTEGNYLAQGVLSPLFYTASSGEEVPILGQSYEFADDQRSAEITLREGIEYSDGSPVDAASVVATFEHYMAEGSTYVFRSTALDVGAEFIAVDDRTVRISFAKPVFHPEYAYWDILRLLLNAPILSPTGLADPDLAIAEPMSVGPYTIEDYEPGIEATLVRNPDYWDPESFPYDTVVLKAFDDPSQTAGLNALKSGQVDVTRITTEQIAEAEASGFRVQYGSWTYVTLQFRDPDGGKSVPLRDVRVRQAMAYAFDREAIAESIDLGYGEVSSQILIEGNPGYIEGGDDRYPYDPEKARELLADAGYADGFDLVLPGGGGKYDPVVQQYLGDIGIRVTYQPFADAGGAFKAFTSPDWPVTLYEEPNINAIRLLDEEFVGFGRYFDPDETILALLERVKFGDAEDSAAASQELGEKLLEEVWYIPIARPPYAFASTADNAVDTNDFFGGGSWLFEFHPVED